MFKETGGDATREGGEKGASGVADVEKPESVPDSSSSWRTSSISRVSFVIPGGVVNAGGGVVNAGVGVVNAGDGIELSSGTRLR